MEQFFSQNTWEGRFFCTENGQKRGLFHALPRGAMLGLHLQLPRALAARSPLALLSSDGGERIALPLSLVRSEGGVEEYAALFDTARAPRTESLFFLSLSVDCPYGRLFASFGTAEEVLFSLRAGAPLPLRLFEEREHACCGSVFVLPYDRIRETGAICRGADGDFDRFFAHLAAHGVRTLLLPLQRADTEACQGALTLPAAFAEAAEEHGVCCLFDLFPHLSLHNALARECLPLSLADPTGAPPSPEGGLPSLSPLALCGEEGILFRALAGGYDGVFLRYADRFGDGLLSAVRASLSALSSAAPLFACTACDAPDSISFGSRRRFFDGGLDGLVSYTLRDALVPYLLFGETEPLSQYLSRTLATMPAAGALLPVHPLTGDAGESFHSVLAGAAEGKTHAPLSSLAHLGELIAATLPGAPTLSPEAAGEDTLAFRLRLFGLCRRERALTDGDLRLHTLTPDLLVFSRAREGEMLLTVINRSGDLLGISSEEGFSVLFGGRGRKHLFRLPPYSGTLLRLSLYSGEQSSLCLRRQPILSRDTRFAPRALLQEEKSS